MLARSAALATGGACSNRGAQWKLTEQNVDGDESTVAEEGECSPRETEMVPEADLVVEREVEVGIGG
jgi:hypothetical protein